jgi:NitT/TauT family transport system permease protein
MKAATWARIVILAVAVAILELACRAGYVSNFTMIPPSVMAIELVKLLVTGQATHSILLTLTNIVAALTLAVVVGFVAGAVLFLLPRARRVVDPLLATYYAIPVFVFYPLFIVLFGLNRLPQIMVGFLLAVVAMIISTLNGFDRVPSVLLKTARIARMGRVATIRLIILPYATLYISTGLKLAVAYSFIGVIAAEFIMSGEGLGYEISFAFNNFDNKTMYPLILFILVISTAMNMALYAWEKRFLERQTRA